MFRRGLPRGRQVRTPKVDVSQMRTNAFWIAAARIAVHLISLSFFSLAAVAAARPGGFAPLGPGGGGAMFNPTISPHDPNTVLVSCDMTGAYITHDGGENWRMFNLGGTIRFFVFDPVNAKIIYAANNGLWRSTDDGETWELVYPKPAAVKGVRMGSDHADGAIVAEPNPLGVIVALAIDPQDNRVLYASAQRKGGASLFVSHDSGASWREVNKLPEAARRIWIDSASPKGARTLYMAGTHSFMVKKAEGLRDFPVPFTVRDASLGFAGAAKPIIYAASPTGLFVSRDGSETWSRSSLPGSDAQVRAVATSLHHPEIAYVSFRQLREGNELLNKLRGEGEKWFGVAKTTDAGKTWQFAWEASNAAPANVHDAWITGQFGPGWAENPIALAVGPQDPNLVYSTDFGRMMNSVDGGANWTALYSRQVDDGWASTGLDVTTSYGIHFDPFDHNHEFITYTDIGLFRSDDGAKSWQSSRTGIPKEWENTTYWIAFDPDVRGRMWSVNSDTHDLPRAKMWKRKSILDYRGGVCRSDDGGKTWIQSSDGMDETAPTHILLDPKSPVNARVLYVAAFGRGVYKSTDGGNHWVLKNNGIVQSQPLAWRVAMDSAGTLYVILARRSDDGSIGNEGDGAIYRSRDGAEHWTRVPLPSGVNGPNGLAIDPENPARLYLAAWGRAAGMHGDGGGIFLSNDGGKTWRQVLDRDRHIYDVTIDPRDPRVLYAAGFESSAWMSTDRGEHWRHIAGFNFKWGHRVIPDPADPKSIYITTFGGSVWHGRTDRKPAVVDVATPVLDPVR